MPTLAPSGFRDRLRYHFENTLSRVDFHTVIEAAARRGETAIGYRQQAQSQDPERGYGVRASPRKPEKETLAADDQIIVLAED